MDAQTPKPLTSRQKAKQKTQTRILAAAQEAFHHHGYDAVTMRDLAKTIGRRSPNWPSKQGGCGGICWATIADAQRYGLRPQSVPLRLGLRRGRCA